MAIPTLTRIIRTIRITPTMGQTGIRQRTRIGTMAPIEIRVGTRSGRIRAIPHDRDRPA